MITLLSYLFIPNRENTQDPKVRQQYGMLTSCTGIFLNLMLFGGKFFAGILSHSIAITADAFNNLSDAASSFITLIGFELAGQKPDPDHPFGHGRFEYISGLFVAMFILLMGFELLKSSIQKIFHPEELLFSPVIMIILICSILVKGYMAYYNRKFGQRINSAAMKATSLDSLSDMVATLVILIATVFSHYKGVSIDGYCGVLVSLFIFYAGINAAKDTINPLLGQAPDPEFVQQITDIVLSYDDVHGIHDLIVHSYGPGRVLISLHAEVAADGNLLDLHNTIDEIEHKLRDTLQCSAVIHLDPICVEDEETDTVKLLLQNHLKTMDSGLSLHDFRLVKTDSQTKVLFDLSVPYQSKMSDAELIDSINKCLMQKNLKYIAIIDIDRHKA